MRTDEVISKNATGDATVARVDLKLEAVVIPVAGVDRAKEFYGKLGWRLDADFAYDNGFRVVQFTPPGSACSIQFGANITSAAPGSAQGLYLIVSSIEAAREVLIARGVKISEVFHAGTPGAHETAAWAHRPCRDGVRLGGRFSECAEAAHGQHEKRVGHV